MLEMGVMFATSTESLRGPRALPRSTHEMCLDELPASPRLSKYDFPPGQERLLGFVETVTFSPGRDSAQGAGALPRADPPREASQRHRQASPFLSFSA